ncbi:type IV pilus modification protein PilV [Nitrincola sp.]|uniref:type IV pilus modification protein PilV n=1 Tax=Nitrincola sp. TaxID=1926584 RepID=UPI003A9369B4
MKYCIQKKGLSKQTGVGMLEVLIALVVLAVGALGFAGLQLVSLKNSNEANFRAQATLIIQDAIERVQSNPKELDRYFTVNNWSTDHQTVKSVPPELSKCISNSCTSAEMAGWDIAYLQWKAANTLPLGRVIGSPCGFNSMDCMIVSWNEQDITECIDNNGLNTAGADTYCVVMEVSR